MNGKTDICAVYGCICRQLNIVVGSDGPSDLIRPVVSSPGGPQRQPEAVGVRGGCRSGIPCRAGLGREAPPLKTETTKDARARLGT